MDLMKNCEIVNIDENESKYIFLLLDRENREIHEIIWNKKAFDKSTKSWVESDEQIEKVKGYAKEILGVELDNLQDSIGQKHDVYCYETFDSFWPVSIRNKVPKELIGQIFQAKIKDVRLDDDGIYIDFDYEGDTYTSNMRFTQKVGEEYFVNPQKKRKQFANFEEKFNTPVEQRSKLIGKNIMVEIKSAFGNPYAEIKKLPAKRK